MRHPFRFLIGVFGMNPNSALRNHACSSGEKFQQAISITTERMVIPVTGFANKWAALIGLVCLAAAIVAAPAQAFPTRSTSITNVTCTPSYTTVTCTFNTISATKATLAEGTDWKNMVSVTEVRKHTSHRLSFKGLEPGVQYDAKIQAGGSSAKTTFATLGPATASPPTVKASGRYWTLNGGRFIPIVAKNSIWGPFVSGDVGCLQPNELSSELATGAKIVLVDKYYSGMANCGNSAVDQQSLMSQAATGQLWWNYFGSSPLAPDTSQPQLAGVLGWPAMTMEIPNRQSWLQPFGLIPSWYIDGLAECSETVSWSLSDGLKWALTQGPQMAGILLGSTYSFAQAPEKSCESPIRITNEFWTSAGLGAGVAWDEWASQGRRPDTFDPIPALVKAASKLSRQAETLAPVLTYGRKIGVKYLGKIPLGATLRRDGQKVAVKPAEPVHVQAWLFGGQLYVLSINAGGQGRTPSDWQRSRPATVSVKLAGLKVGKARGLWGSKGIKLTGSTATIHLPSIGTGWYAITPTK